MKTRDEAKRAGSGPNKMKKEYLRTPKGPFPRPSLVKEAPTGATSPRLKAFGKEEITMGNSNNGNSANPDASLLAGIQKNLSSQAFIIAGEPQTLAQVQAVLQGRVTLDQTVATAKAAYDGAVKARAANLAVTATYVHDLRQIVKAMFSSLPQTLADFGMTPNKPRTPLTAAEKVLAVVKGQATRKARGTLGKNQKAKIQGTVAGPVTVSTNGQTSVATSNGSTPSGSSVNGTSSTPTHA
jgi:hypothetical protein